MLFPFDCKSHLRNWVEFQVQPLATWVHCTDGAWELGLYTLLGCREHVATSELIPTGLVRFRRLRCSKKATSVTRV